MTQQPFHSPWPPSSSPETLEALHPDSSMWTTVVDAIAGDMLTRSLQHETHGVARGMQVATTLRGDWRIRMLTAWIDTLLHALGFTADRTPTGQRRRVGAVSMSTATCGMQELAADELPPLPRWVARLITARAGLDVDGQHGLMAAAPADASSDDQLLAVLYAVTMTMNHHPRLNGEQR